MIYKRRLLEIKKNEITFREIADNIKKYLILEGKDEYIIDLILATAMSIDTERPVWLMIVAAPSSGKTEILNILSKVKQVHLLYNITPRFLFSGHRDARGGYMLRQVKKRGVLLFPDFTTILSMNSRARNEIFNQLRVIYDGKAGLGTGIDEGKAKTWTGMDTVISNVTESIERIKNRQSDMGKR